MELKEMIAVMQAAAQGEKIQLKRKSELPDRWVETYTPGWDWYTYEYRVKPKEPRVFYLAVSTKHNKAHIPGVADLTSKETYGLYNPLNGQGPWDYIKVVEELT